MPSFAQSSDCLQNGTLVRRGRLDRIIYKEFSLKLQEKYINEPEV